MKLLLSSVVLFTALSAVAKSPVYLAEELTANTILNAGSPYCVSWVNAALPNYRVSYNGTEGSSYSCEVSFAYRNLQSAHDGSADKIGSRVIRYQALANQYRDKKNLGRLAEDSFGYFSLGHPNAAGMEAIMNFPAQAIYRTLGFLSELFSIDPKDKALRLVPKFDKVYDSKVVSCQLIAVELAAHACPDSGDAIKTGILNSIRASEQLAQKRRLLIPSKR